MTYVFLKSIWRTYTIFFFSNMSISCTNAAFINYPNYVWPIDPIRYKHLLKKPRLILFRLFKILCAQNTIKECEV